jgi:hypothetical protein
MAVDAGYGCGEECVDVVEVSGDDGWLVTRVARLRLGIT